MHDFTYQVLLTLPLLPAGGGPGPLGREDPGAELRQGLRECEPCPPHVRRGTPFLAEPSSERKVSWVANCVYPCWVRPER